MQTRQHGLDTGDAADSGALAPQPAQHSQSVEAGRNLEYGRVFLIHLGDLPEDSCSDIRDAVVVNFNKKVRSAGEPLRLVATVPSPTSSHYHLLLATGSVAQDLDRVSDDWDKRIRELQRAAPIFTGQVVDSQLVAIGNLGITGMSAEGLTAALTQRLLMRGLEGELPRDYAR